MERFEAKYIPEPKSGSWLWVGSTNSTNYGNFRLNGKTELAHRVSYQLNYGAISKDICVLHKCDNPPCVNPDHLFLGSRRDNSDDMIAKNRAVHPVAEGIKNTKLMRSQVIEIRTSIEADRKLAPKYGISRSLIGAIRRREIWKHI